MGHRLLFVIAACFGILLSASGAVPHDWYPLECCSAQDCSPAETVVRQEDGSYLVTAHGLAAVIPANYPNWRKSPDGRIHVCIRKLRSGAEYLVCAFRGPGV